MAIWQTKPKNIVFKAAGRPKVEDLYLKMLNESKGRVVTGFSFSDKAGEYTVPHDNRDWKLYRMTYQKIGVVSNAVDNTANFAIQSGYELEGSDADKKVAQKWIEENDFNLFILNILKEMQVFGNAYLEISEDIKLLPVENMFVVVNKGKNDGVLKGYKQKIDLSRNTVEFKPEEIVHFKWGELGTEFYGHSDIEAAIGTLTYLLNFQVDIGEIMHNYAHPIIHYLLGAPEAPATSDQIDDFKALRDELKTGEDLITSQNVEHKIIAADLRMIQIDGMLKHMENQLIAALQVPEIFVRGGQSSNKATADVELQAFDRRVKALRSVISQKIEDEIFELHLGVKVKISWHEMSVESEALKGEMMVNLVNAGVPTKTALQMVGWGSWVDNYEEDKKEDDERQKALMPPPGAQMGKPAMKPNETPKEEDFDTQKDWLDAVAKFKKKYK